MLYTSYFAQLKNLPKDIVPISICGRAPDWYDGLQYKKLAPKYRFFMEWKRNHDNNFYIKHFNEEVLNQLNVNNIIKDLKSLVSNNSIALICYEKPDDFCHRHLVANWFNENGVNCKEWTN